MALGHPHGTRVLVWLPSYMDLTWWLCFLISRKAMVLLLAHPGFAASCHDTSAACVTSWYGYNDDNYSLSSNGSCPTGAVVSVVVCVA
jgi:hypothetical protein